MAKTKLTPRSSGTACRTVSAAAKRPEKTNTFLDEIDKALADFDDEVSSPSTQERQTAYNNLAITYKNALMTIWDKASVASVKTVLSTVSDKELHELRRIARLLEPRELQPQVIPEQREVPDLDNILGTLTSRLPSQTLQPEALQKLIATRQKLQRRYRT